MRVRHPPARTQRPVALFHLPDPALLRLHLGTGLATAPAALGLQERHYEQHR